jgi:hypothetical protein
MTNEQLSTLARYALYALIGAAIAAGLKLGAELPGSDPIEWREIASVFILSFCGTLSTAVGTSTLSRPGSEGIRTQVDGLRAQGVHREDMIVLPRDEAALAVAGNGAVEAALTPTQLTQVSDELERRMKAQADDERLAERATEGRG